MTLHAHFTLNITSHFTLHITWHYASHKRFMLHITETTYYRIYILQNIPTASWAARRQSPLEGWRTTPKFSCTLFESYAQMLDYISDTHSRLGISIIYGGLAHYTEVLLCAVRVLDCMLHVHFRLHITYACQLTHHVYISEFHITH